MIVIKPILELLWTPQFKINDPIKKGIQNGDSCYKALTRGYSNQSALDKKIGEFINCFKSKTFL